MVCCLILKDAEIFQGTTAARKTIRPGDVPGTLLNMVSVNKSLTCECMLIAVFFVRLCWTWVVLIQVWGWQHTTCFAHWQLTSNYRSNENWQRHKVCAQQSWFIWEDFMWLLSSFCVSGVCIPGNNTIFIKTISSHLAANEPHLTLEVYTIAQHRRF